ncbi:MAG TPA: 2-polyprenyl-3-methyl-6-methoxy-1,4-benzoquinone monooxygenase [Acidiferrobacter sp.]|nr:2-polyprenyl-3-methyl-6-methoxy-1,4-benzoquinone monooxygenase [Acidiferrobacter sp.]
MRIFPPIDRIVDQADQTLRTVFVRTPIDPYPDTIPREEGELTAAERALEARLMRVNHAGEVAAQALYQGHALYAVDAPIRAAMRSAGRDELNHLHWTSARLKELHSHRSYLTPLWYAGALAIGAGTALFGDKISLSFMAETERQVVDHLQGHLAKLPQTDHKSRAILEHMVRDEARHATQAMAAGGQPLPAAIRLAMRLAAKVMTQTAFWI